MDVDGGNTNSHTLTGLTNGQTYTISLVGTSSSAAIPSAPVSAETVGLGNLENRPIQSMPCFLTQSIQKCVNRLCESLNFPICCFHALYCFPVCGHNVIETLFHSSTSSSTQWDSNSHCHYHHHHWQCSQWLSSDWVCGRVAERHLSWLF